ncbi:MAG: hypothetical protein AABX60_03490 [Nanoarchaeota archaeon]
MADSASFDFTKEWAVRYVRHRDIAAKKISEIKDTDYGFQIINKDGTLLECVVQLTIKGISQQFIAATKNVLVITLSNDENIQAVYKMWDALAANRALLIVFVNHFSALEDKWVLKPYLHNKVCDRNSLLQGLRAMSELVEPIDEETLTLKVRSVAEFETDSQLR